MVYCSYAASVGVGPDVGVLVAVGVSVKVGVDVKVGVNVGVMVGVNVGVKVSVEVGGLKVAVCVNAAFAVSTMEVLMELASKVGMGAGAKKFDELHASMDKARIKNSFFIPRL